MNEPLIANLPLTLDEFTALRKLIVQCHSTGASKEIAAILQKLEEVKPGQHAYLVLITWPDGKEGLLFPRPGNVPVAATVEAGKADFAIALNHLDAYGESRGNAPGGASLKGTVIRLVEFQRGAVLSECTI
jgi:hypothetical protein